jgi:hypothetical protein
MSLSLDEYFESLSPKHQKQFCEVMEFAIPERKDQKRISVFLDVDLLERIEADAEGHGVSKGIYINAAIRGYYGLIQSLSDLNARLEGVDATNN